MPFLGAPSVYGFRYSGFSYGSTAVAPLIAVAICVVVMPWVWQNRRTVLRIILLGTLLSGLILSQGRGGLLGLIVALTVLVFVYLLRKPVLTLVWTIIGTVTLLVSGAVPALIDYVSRADAPGTSDLTSGRLELNLAAWQVFWRSGLLGLEPAEYDLYNPHMAPLSAALNIGPFGLVATSVICVLLFVIIVFAPSDFPVLFRMIASIALVTAFLEPTGFFVGFTGAMLVMICFAQYRGSSIQVQQERQSLLAHSPGSS